MSEPEDGYGDGDPVPAWEPQVTNDTELEAALEQIAELEYQKAYGQARALAARIEKYEYMRKMLVDRIDHKIALLESAIDGYARPMLTAQGKAVYTGAFGTYRITKRRSMIGKVDAKTLVSWCSMNVTELPLYDTVTVEQYKPNKDLIEAHVHQTGVVPDGVELQDLESFTVKPDITGIEGKGDFGEQEKSEGVPA